jgi:hypothetical protein
MRVSGAVKLFLRRNQIHPVIVARFSPKTRF